MKRSHLGHTAVIGNGEIISEFTWDNGGALAATLGPDASRCGEGVHPMSGGRASTMGLSPGENGKGINLEIPVNEMFNTDGIDISIDYRRNEDDADFITRGGSFRFGMKNGYLFIRYAVENHAGRTEQFEANTGFEIPADPQFRTYRFMYNPVDGKAEIFVNHIIVWQSAQLRNSKLAWNKSANLLIGRGMDGNGADRAIIDNLIIRTTHSITPLSESLLTFILESQEGVGVKLRWSNSLNEKVDFFTIERSVNGKDFTVVAKIPARKDSTGCDYSYLDVTNTNSNIVYYRLRQTFMNGRYASTALSAIRFKSDKSFSIEKINPIPFKNTCDICYFLPGNGFVWMQVSDESGKVVKTTAFEARRGKNVHIFKDDIGLKPGPYTFSLIFQNKKCSARIIKA